ncbi:hypothetical protein H0X48_06615 [Candidatus Dependentiae bacterium]|nr:hypothetical protein [Candidatus Dependentiae bacterium]
MIRRMAYVLLLLLATSIFTINNSKAAGDVTPTSFKTRALSFLGHWAVAAGPSWLEAYKYCLLLSEKQALEFFGDDDLTPELTVSLRYHLKQVNYEHWNTLPLKSIKADMQPSVYSPLVCTDSLLFVNPDFYNELTEGEKKAVIAHAVNMIEQKQILTSACVMAVIPFVTQTLTTTYTYCTESLYLKLPHILRSTPFIKNTIAAHNYVATSAILKVILNHIAADMYYKYTAKKNDVDSAKRTNTAQELLSYYIKRSQRMPYKSWFSKRNEPTLHQRMKYLMPLIKRSFIPEPEEELTKSSFTI